MTVNGKEVHDYGFQVRQLDALLRANGLSTNLVIVSDTKSERRKNRPDVRIVHVL
jgi:hypothetical protein